MSWFSRFVFVSFATVLLAGCGGGAETTNNTQNPPPTTQCSDGVDNDGDGDIDLADAGCSDASDNNEADDPAPVGGLDARPSNLTCIAPDRAPPSGGIEVVDAFPNLPNIGQMTKVLVEPVANPRWFVLRKNGEVRVFDPDNANSAPTYLDLSGVVRTASEGGLLGMAFHPDYPTVPEIFLSYTIDNRPTSEMLSVFSRVILDDPATPSPIGAGSVEERFLLVEQFASNHNGGDIAFGPDRLLYIGLGDGGGGGDPRETGQDTTNLLGAFLRIDVIGTGTDYNIPVNNPFNDGDPKCGRGLVNPNDCPEIYAWGVRNPWRWSFDAPSGVLWAGDVGQGAWEEIDQIELGGNYGWDCREGAHDYETTGCVGPFDEPVAEYSHALGESVTGGYVYRGTALPALAGRYVFGDFVSGRIWALQPNGAGGFDLDELVASGDNPSTFAIDQDGEVYYGDYGGGRIMQLVAGGGGGADPVPDLLSQSGCVDPADITQPYAGLVPYDLNAPFWSDGAAKDRHMGLPDGTTISVDADDDWNFPAGTVTVKNFRLNGRLIETRHLMRHPDGEWAGYTYEWNAAETEATRVRGGKTVNIDGQDWIYPSEAECLQCHTAIAGRALGPETAQLNKDFSYPQTGRTANQLTTLDAVSMFATPIGDPAVLPALADPTDVSASLNDRARAYLHTNCAQCHQPGGPTPVNIDLRYTTALADTNACDAVPQAGGLGVMMPRIIAPGDASRSLLVLRTNRRDVNGMPPLGSTVVDAAGVALLTDWINGLANCN